MKIGKLPEKIRQNVIPFLFLSLSSGVLVYILLGAASPNTKPVPVPTNPVVTVTTTPVVETKHPPVAIRIPAIKSELPVQAALVHDNQWDMFDNAVAWLSTSAVPGEGNVILYAHNRANLWRDLYKVKPGDVIEVQQQDTWLRYIVTESRTVTPKDIDAILASQEQLTMYTCEGTFDQKRRLVYATPEK